MLKKIPVLFESGQGSGFLLLLMAVLALIVVNSPLNHYYQTFFNYEFGYAWHDFAVVKPLLLWINDGLMAVFFLMVGLEIKHELIDGELNTLSKASLPLFAAMGGMLIPALVYIALTWQDPLMRQGWAIPSATDIAFTLAVFAMLKSRIPPALKALITALAIIDDLGAIIIIALFYTQDLSLLAIALAIICCFLLFLFNRMRIKQFFPYAIIGLILWLCVLKSGVHATLAGVVVAWAYPHEKRSVHVNYTQSTSTKIDPSISISNEASSCFQQGSVPIVHDLAENKETTKLQIERRRVYSAATLEHQLNPWVNYFILPLFAFANAGVIFQSNVIQQLLAPVALGIAVGLFLGKQLGILSISWLAVRLRVAAMPKDTTWGHFYGAAVLCGIGFTMSLFIGSLAFNDVNAQLMQHVRTGVLLGSILSGIWGSIVLRWTPAIRS